MHRSVFIGLFIFIVATACTLSDTPSEQIQLTSIPTTVALDAQPTRTPISTANQDTPDNGSPVGSQNTTDNTRNDINTVNTDTTANNTPRDTQTIICNKQTSWNTYTVVAGDTLFGIAQRSNSTVDTLVSANCLVDAGLIEVGQVLYVPNPVTQPVPDTNTNTTDDNPQLDPNRYTTELWWIIQGDGGSTGFAVGCGDSIYLQQSGIPANLGVDRKLVRAFEYLTDDNNYGAGIADKGWWNPMSQTNLMIQNYTVDGNLVNMNLAGELNLSGVCFDAQLEAQIALNVMSLTGTRSAIILVNGRNLKNYFSGSGQDVSYTYTWDEFQNGGSAVTNELIEYWVGVETNGASNRTITVGCESYLMPIEGDILVSGDLRKDIELALMQLFDPNRRLPGNVYTNYLKDQNLIVQSVDVNGGDVVVTIGGQIMGIGTCGDPIIEAQILQTVFQFEQVQTVKVTNGQTNLRQLVDQSGLTDLTNYVYTRSN